jgi:antibiotic biosynthesis monooxygenase (ABM) superfamily enzyme
MEKDIRDTDDRILKGQGKTVTVVVSRMVFPGHEQEYDEWVKKLSEAARQSPGNTGVTILVPAPGKSGLRHVVMDFTDEKSMHIWETSYIRQKLSNEADSFSRRSRQEATGLETWFSIPECPELETPPHWKMAVVTFLAVFVLSIAILKLLKWIFTDMNFYLESFLVATLLVVILTWIVMPFLSRHVFRKWLYK